jgi:hypothetical protein
MARYRRSFRKYSAKPKRNSERVIRAGATLVAATSQQVVYTWEAREACTVKSIKLDLGVSDGVGAEIIAYCLVRIPEGYSANPLTYPALTTDLYNPTELVLISGVLTDVAVEDHKFNSIGRKMKAGDRMGLIVLNPLAGDSTVAFEISFSVLT